MYRKFIFNICLICSLFLVSCATNCTSPQNVIYGDRVTLAFTGKGAAAGMMMDAYLGGAGVAIGIAIDEGIAKDIAANISSRHGGFDMLDVVKKELDLKSHSLNKKQKQIVATKISIETYGFRTAPGDGDKVSAWLKIRFVDGGSDSVLTYPDDFTSPATIELNDAKTKPQLAFNTLKNATDLVLEKWISTLK